MLKRMLTIGAMTVGLLLLTAGIATAHYTHWGQLTWVDEDGEGCSYVDSQMDHDENIGQTTAKTLAACAWFWERPPNHIKVKWQMLYRNPVWGNWTLCTSVNTEYNEGYSTKVKVDEEHEEAPCGDGTYNLRTTGGVKKEGTWYGHLYVMSGSHYFEE